MTVEKYCGEIHFQMDFQMCSENPPLPLSCDVKGPLENEERMTLRMTVRHCWQSYKMGLANVKAMSMGVYRERRREKKNKTKKKHIQNVSNGAIVSES